jgi:hypothetical protein
MRSKSFCRPTPGGSKAQPDGASARSPGAINPAELYRSDEARARAGWRKSAFQSACRRGLKVHRCGKWVYVAGADLIAFITAHDEDGGRR